MRQTQLTCCWACTAGRKYDIGSSNLPEVNTDTKRRQ